MSNLPVCKKEDPSYYKLVKKKKKKVGGDALLAVDSLIFLTPEFLARSFN